MNRRLANKNITVLSMATNTENISENNQITMDYTTDPVSAGLKKVDKDCQVDFLCNSNEAGKTFACNRYIYLNAYKCDAEIQTDITDVKSKTIISQKKYKDKECNTPIKNRMDQSSETLEKTFLSFESLSNNEQLIDLAGVTFNNFKFLLKRTNV